MPQSVPLAVYRGDTCAWSFTFWTDAAATEPYDLTDATARAQTRLRPDEPVLTEFDCTVTPPNKVDVNLPADRSALLTGGKSQWDLQLTFSDGTIQTPVAGPLTVTADITRPV